MILLVKSVNKIGQEAKFQTGLAFGGGRSSF
jgi:hypothetical protein